VTAGNILEVRDLTKHFPIHAGVFRRVVGQVKAVDGVSFSLREGETLGLVGESGCGKTTLGRCVLRLIEPTSGEVLLQTQRARVDLAHSSRRELKVMRREAQMIFQDPVSSLDPRMTVGDVVAEPLVIHRLGTPAGRRRMVQEALESVRLSPDMVNRYPHEFSGGQRQRIGLARALVVKPRLLVCDEPVSALDVSVQAQVLNLLEELRRGMGLSLLFIAHNLGVVEHISDRVAVMYLGRIVECAPSLDLYRDPLHPYSAALMASIPRPDPRAKRVPFVLEGSVPDPSAVPPGCAFHERCRYAVERCSVERPPLVRAGSDGSRGDHDVACHRAAELDLASELPSDAIGWLSRAERGNAG
jgi:oligopeptide/dipeptide ABC transporter ATP-binding protein